MGFGGVFFVCVCVLFVFPCFVSVFLSWLYWCISTALTIMKTDSLSKFDSYARKQLREVRYNASCCNISTTVSVDVSGPFTVGVL